jgi:hypothetical protein
VRDETDLIRDDERRINGRAAGGAGVIKTVPGRLSDGKIAMSCVNIFSRFGSRADRESEVVGEGKGPFVRRTDKGPAVRYGIFGVFHNELVSFSPGRQS